MLATDAATGEGCIYCFLLSSQQYAQPLSFHISCRIFSDSKIAKNYSFRRTKMACIINGAVAPFFQQNLVEHIKKNPFSIAIDGSSDNYIEKVNPLTVRIFYIDCGNVRTQFLDICMSSSSTAEGIF